MTYGVKYFLILIFFAACQGESHEAGTQTKYSRIEGETMGTYYRVTTDGSFTLQADLDSILLEINMAVSTYIPESEISAFNKDQEGTLLAPGYFQDNFRIASYFFDITEGSYDPTVMPLVNYWGFGYEGKRKVLATDSLKVHSLREFVGLDKIVVKKLGDSLQLTKKHPKVELDFSSVAKGYAVDVIADFLGKNGVLNYLVDIGGEMRMKGKNPSGKKWSIGINTPEEGAALNDAIRYISVTDKGLATSGNYRNFYEVDGRKISHTINPKSGFPERSDLLSVTILTDNCARADAWATSCMVLGTKKSLTLLRNHPEVSACLIYNENDELAVQYVNDFEDFLAEQ